jgi:hypothetical protein
MSIFTIIAFSSVFVAIFSIYFAIFGYHYLYWLAAIAIYVFSCLSAFSIGQKTVGLTFVLLALAIGGSLNFLNNMLQFMICFLVGLGIGVLMVLYVDDAWLFFPLRFLN